LAKNDDAIVCTADMDTLGFLLRQPPALQGAEILSSTGCFSPLIFPESRGGPEKLRQGRTLKGIIADALSDQLPKAWMV